MSETDSFIEEVSEEVRNDRLFRTFKRYGWIAASLVVIIVGGFAYNEYRKAAHETASRVLGDAVLTALDIEDAGARADALGSLASDDAAAAAVLALSQAAALADAGAKDQADAALASLAASAQAPDIYRDLARIKRLTLVGSGMSDDDRRATIQALSVPGNPFRTLAREQQALMHVELGETDAALEVFHELLSDSETTAPLAQRARQMIVILGGDLNAG